MQFTFFQTPFDKKTDLRQDMTWADVRSLLTTHLIRVDKQGQGFSPCKYIDHGCACGSESCPGPAGHATNANVVEVYMMPIDLDKGRDGGDLTSPEDLQHLKTIEGKGVAFIAHTSHSYAPPAKAKWHVFIPFSRPVKAAEYRRVWKAAIKWLGVPSGITTDFPARFWNLPSHPPGGSSQIREHDGAPLDVDWLLAMAEPEQPVSSHDAIVEHEAPLGVRKAAWEHIKALGPAVAGEDGHNHTFQVARCLINDWALNEDEALELLHDWNHACSPPWTDGELEHKLQGALSAGPSNDYGELRSGQEFLMALETINAAPVGTPLARFQWATRVWAASESVKVDNDTTEMFMTAKELMAKQFPKTPWLIRGLLTEGGVATISAEPKATKTWAAMEWCLAVSSGDKAFGEFQAIQGGAAYFFAEDQGGSIQSRIGALCKGTGRDVPDAFYLEPCGQSLNMMEDQSATALLAAASRIPDLKLLVLDPLRNVHSGKEDSSDEMSQLMGRLSRLATILKCTVLFVHHNAKSSADTSTRRHGQKMRGSSAVHGAITSGFYMVNTAEDPETGAIVNTCHTEVKGAKSAGKFHVALQIVDNEFDVAESAEWQILEEDARATGDQDMAAAIMALGEWGRNASRNGAPLAQDLKGLVSGCRLDEMKKALKACVAQGFMKDVMVSGLQCGYEFTDAGRTAFNEMTSAGVSVDQVKSKGKSHR